MSYKISSQAALYWTDMDNAQTPWPSGLQTFGAQKDFQRYAEDIIFLGPLPQMLARRRVHIRITLH